MWWEVSSGAIKAIIFLLIVYAFGYFGFSPLWPATVMFFIVRHQRKTEEKRRKLRVRQVMALSNEKNVILNSLSELPPWMKFSEIEKVEWINRILTLIWQEVNTYAQSAVKQVLEPVLNQYVNNFSFNVISLGNVPLRVDGINVYESIDKKKIEMDLDISYSGDCYVTFESFKFTGGIKDIKLQGRLRVALTPLISRVPLIGGVKACFMDSPHIDFDLIKATQILDFPGIRSRVKAIAMEIVNSQLLYPNSISIKLDKDVNLSRMAVFRVQGVLRVHVVEAKNLKKTDLIGDSDPYVVLKVGSIKITTPVIKSTLNPKWDFWEEFEVEPNSELKIEVWDKDEGMKDDFLGRARIDVSQVAREGKAEKPLLLQGVDTGRIYLRMVWLSLSDQYDDLKSAIQEATLLSPYLHSSLFMIYLESSSNLSADETFVELEVEGTVKSGDIEKGTKNPIWEKGFTFLLVHPERAILYLRVKEAKDREIIGEAEFQVKELVKQDKMEIKKKNLALSNSKMSIYCSMKLRVLKNTVTEDIEKNRSLKKQESNVSNFSKASTLSSGSGSEFVSAVGKVKLRLEYSGPRQRLIIKICEVTISHEKTLDPYVKLSLLTSDLQPIRFKTKVKKSTNDPIYNETFEFVISKQDLSISTLKLEVKSSTNLFTRPRKVGIVQLDLARCDEMQPLTEWFNLCKKQDVVVCTLVN